MPRRRLDAELVRRGLAGSREEARRVVLAGSVSVGGVPAAKPATLVGPDDPVRISGGGEPFVSRGGVKLAAALDAFTIDVSGLVCLDAGASTGGFTDCLLQRGARRIIAVDVGHGQLAWSLRNDPRVTVMEKVNVRTLAPGDLDERPNLLVADLSFISLRTALPSLTALGASRAVVLVKPQFEAGPRDVGPGGVVRDTQVWTRVLTEVRDVAIRLGWSAPNLIVSPLRGPAGNVEFLMDLVEGSSGSSDPDIDGVVGSVGEA